MADLRRFLFMVLNIDPRTRNVLLLLVLLTFSLYLPSLLSGFVWDDPFVVLINDFVHSWKNLPLVFSREYLTRERDMSFSGLKMIGSGELSYRPVVTLSYFLDWAIWKDNPFGYHLHNLFYHIFNTLFVYALTAVLTRRRWAAVGGALYFAWHPIHAEAVSAVANREDLQFFFFYMAALLGHIRSRSCAPRARQRWVTVSCLSFFLALFAKEMAVTLPVMLFLYDLIYVRQERKTGGPFWPGRRYALYGLILIFYFYIRFFVIYMPRDPRILWLGNNFYTHLIILLKIIGVYLFWLVIPVGWHHIVPEDASFAAYSFREPAVLVSFLVLVGLTVTAVLRRRRNPGLTFAIAWFFITLSPVLNFYPQQNFAALRYLYLPSVGLALALALGLRRVFESRRMMSSRPAVRALAAGGVLVLSVYAVGTLKGIAIWKDDLTFGRHLAEHYPDVARLRCNLGTHYRDRGYESKALEEIEAALAADPRYGKAYLSRAVIYFNRGELEKARRDLERTLEYDFRLWQVHFHLARVYAEQGLYDRAIEQFQRLLLFIPGDASAHINLGMIYFKRKEFGKARQMWERALESEPDNAIALDGLRRLSIEERRRQ